ncbi:GNAT family N-acetyltransferase [Lysinibacillus sp. 3P01SB]|uniref:GNAT family N-acetyltransferase n=1 Tax=Lysinibacillus sp. 3P01SB TaxID=3132284 RepID=UPI0039A50569
MKITQMESKDGFEYIQDGNSKARIIWAQEEDTMVMNGTHVSEELRGQGVAKKLLDEAADYARKNGYKMKAVCPYVADSFEKNSEYNDVKA